MQAFGSIVSALCIKPHFTNAVSSDRSLDCITVCDFNREPDGSRQPTSSCVVDQFMDHHTEQSALRQQFIVIRTAVDRLQEWFRRFDNGVKLLDRQRSNTRIGQHRQLPAKSGGEEQL